MSTSNEERIVIYTFAEIAINWLRKSRKHYSHNAGCWDFFHKNNYLESINKVINGQYTLKPMQLRESVNGYRVFWCAEDAFILKFITLYITQYQLLPVSPLCSHVQTSIGNKERIKRISHLCSSMNFVFRTDIKGYFSNIDKRLLLQSIETEIKLPFILNIICQYLFYSVEFGGNVRETQKGICRSCGLSHLLAAYHLNHIDVKFEQYSPYDDYFYTRYMDDFLVLTKKRYPMRKGIKIIKSELASQHFELASDKTQLGRVDKGFDWLGILFGSNGVVGPAPRALINRDNKLKKLNYLQRQIYLERWNRWLVSYLNV
ncbi:reverse transcriptase domain-containing protein [Vibrio lentus]|uniref:reverse transcriptase domain-containing protein n=1 Tax=Vibrio lentus TaxID=136468 RepID=UPI000C827DA8|nr:reverse transcriptase domain-containing protein [Vibrio lentus]PMH03884.1 hypothetical protein BCU78_01970 [Vibrio lentus]